MSLQDIYYVVAITTNILFIVILVFIGFVIWQLYVSLKNFQERIVKEMEDFKHSTIDRAQEFISTPKAEIAGMVGMGVGTFLLSRLKKIIRIF